MLKKYTNGAKNNLEIYEEEKERLYQLYLDSIALRNELAAKANCKDEVEIDQEEIEAVEQCKIFKEEYRQNLEDQTVETAQAIYESYLDNEWANADNDLKEKTEAYNQAVSNREAKETEIDKLTQNIANQNATERILNRNYLKYRKEVYLPAKDAYEDYLENVYTPFKTQYDAYIAEDLLGTKLKELNTAKNETNKAQSDYNAYYRYKTNLENKYDEYRALADEFRSITGSNIDVARTLGLKINIYVQNMLVNVNGTPLAYTADNTAQGTYDLAEYITSKDIPQVKADIPVIDKEVYSNIGGTEMTKKDYNNSYNINKEKENGVRVLAGTANYETQVVIGSKKVNEIKDTVYYSDQSNPDKTVVFRIKNQKISRDYKINTSSEAIRPDGTVNTAIKYKNVDPINVYTPITINAEIDSDNSKIVDQTSNELIDIPAIQINTPFTINLQSNEKDDIYSVETDRFSGGYYVKFDFDVHKVSLNGKTYKNGNIVPAGTWIGLIPKNNKGKSYITVQAYGNIEDNTSSVVSEQRSGYIVRAVAHNATDIILNRSIKYDVLEDMLAETSDLKDLINNICKNPSYFAEKEYSVVIVNRTYDFRITDLKDLNWKSVFRKTSENTTNSHTGNLYYAGTMKWNTKSEKANNIVTRSAKEIGRNPLRTLPLGPYKNTNVTYIKAPKLGYRFSFDMKVTGSYYRVTESEAETKVDINTDKKVEITTKFYYISKDGKTYLPEAKVGKEGIYLFYKTSDGKYVKIDENGGGYNIRFTPNDGYRYISDSDKSTLSTKSLVVGTPRKLTLTHEMATITDNKAAITYYGEYKLPNSTIAVKVDRNGKYDINSPLKNGYIGVVFNIVAYSGKINLGDNIQDVLLSYSKDTKNNAPNTSQWDYEGFLGYTNYGSTVKNDELYLKLENGKWNINNTTYNDIKGSVILYDVDNRADTDYE